MKTLTTIALALVAFTAHANGTPPTPREKPLVLKISPTTTTTAKASAVSRSNAGASASTGGSSVVYTAPRAPAATAYAPPVYPTANCAMGTSFGAQGGVGVSIGSTRIDENCARIEKAKTLAAMGDPATAQEVLCGDPDIRAARKRAGNACYADRQENMVAQSPKCRWMDDVLVRAREGCPE